MTLARNVISGKSDLMISFVTDYQEDEFFERVAPTYQLNEGIGRLSKSGFKLDGFPNYHINRQAMNQFLAAYPRTQALGFS